VSINALLVDDDSSIRSIIARILTRKFDLLTIHECADGLAALEALSCEQYAFMILDLSMPIMDGFDVLESMRATPGLVNMPVIVMTGVNDESMVRRILSVGVTDYILKPLRPTQLCERVARLIKAPLAIGGALLRHGLPVRRLELFGRGFILVVDGNEDFRTLAERILSPLCHVETASSGLEAVQKCLRESPQAVLVGTDLGIFGGEQLARKLRTGMVATGTTIVALETASNIERSEVSGAFDAVIERSLDAEVLLTEIRSLAGR
jgi:CheY-like chemotaxis protein